MNQASLGKTLRWARKRAGMTQHDLAQAVRMPQSTIARIEAGTVTPMTATLMSLLRATGHQLAVEPRPSPVDRDGVRKRLAMPTSNRTRTALGSRAKERRTSPVRNLVRLRWFGVPFVLVGDLAEVAHGRSGPVGPTIEVCIASTDVARERLGKALDDLGELASDGRLRATTATAAGDDYEVLGRNAVTMLVDTGFSAPVAALEDLIRARRAAGTPADLEVVAELEAIAEESASGE